MSNETAPEVRDALNRIADSLSNALASASVTNRILRELGAQEREHGVQSYPDGTGPYITPLEFLSARGPLRKLTAIELAAQAAEELTSRSEITWRDGLVQGTFEVLSINPDLESQALDKELVRTAVTIAAWLKDRNQRRKRAEDLGTVGYDTTEGPEI